jgi:hypothetical protein
MDELKSALLISSDLVPAGNYLQETTWFIARKSYVVVGTIKKEICNKKVVNFEK